MKYACLLLTFIAACFMSYSQDNDIINDPLLLKKYLAQSRFEIDSSAQAVVLYEKGLANTISNSFTYTVEKTIKIIGKDGLKEATVVIPVNENSVVRKVKGVTYNLEGIEISEQRIENSEIIREQVSDGVFVAKFNLPSVKEGSVIYYTYMIESFSSLFVPDWYFQGEFPKLYSEYEIVIPAYIVYTAIERIGKPKTKVKKRSDLEKCDACVYISEVSNYENNNVWVRRNVPAFKEEPFMLAKDNYLERLKVQVTATSSDGYTKAVMKDWDQLNKDVFFKNEKLCGQAFSGNGFLADQTELLLRDKTIELDKARAIYKYVRDSFYKVNTSDYNAQNIKDVFKKKEGNAFGINLLLTAMMRKAGLKSEPVLLATKDKECLNSFYADPSNINYITSKVRIDGKDYFLDASEKYLPFGLLAPDCYNGFARSVNEKGSSLYISPDSITDRSVTIANIIPSSEGKLLVKVDYTLGNVTGYSLRKKWHNDSLIAYKDIAQRMSKGNDNFKIINKRIANLEDPEKPLKISIEAEMNFKEDVLYLDPYVDKFFEKNPFPSNTRMFPITMDYKQDATYVLMFQLPSGYTLDDYPKSATTKFGEDGLIEMQNIIKYDKEKNNLRIQNHFARKATYFDVEDYESLREFYDHIIAEQNKKVVIKKLN